MRERARAGLADDVRQLLRGTVDVVVASPDGPAAERWRLRESRQAQSPGELFAAYLADQGVDDDRMQALFAELLEGADAS